MIDNRELQMGDLVKVTKYNKHVFYTVVTEINNPNSKVVKGPWKKTTDDDISWTSDAGYKKLTLHKDNINIASIEFISDDKELSEFAMKVLTGDDLIAKEYVEELIKQHDKSIVYE